MKIIKKGLRNFLKGLKYYLTPFGATLLFFIFGLCVAIPAISNSITGMINELSKLLGGIKINWNAVKDVMFKDIMKLNWQGDLFGSITKLSDSKFLQSLLVDGVNAAFGKVDYNKIVLEILDRCVGEIIASFIVLIGFVIMGLIVGFVITRMLMQHEIASSGKNFVQFLFRAGLEALIFVGLITLIFWLIDISDSPLLWLAFIAVIIVYAILTLFKAYLVYGLKKVTLKKILNPMQLLWLYTSDIIIIAISAAFVIFCYYVIGALIGVILAIPLAMILIIAIGLNTDSYVRDIVVETNLVK